jgi:hypothetical protein
MTTNKHGLPEPFVRYDEARNAAYSRGNADISATQLIDAPRVRLLRANSGDLEQDVVDSIWPLLGTAVHDILEKHSDPKDVVEERLSMEVENWVLSGAVDHQKISNGKIIITDYKVTSVWSVMLEQKIDWVRQLNIYAELVDHNKDAEVGGVNICAVLRDWSRREASYKKDYPQTPIVIIPIPLWSRSERQRYITERVKAHQDAQIAYDTTGELPACTEEEKWTKPTTWAVMKDKNKRATKVFSNFGEAQKHANMLNGQRTGNARSGTYHVMIRAGENTRCEGDYCQVAIKCPFQQEIIADRVYEKITKDNKGK